MQFLLIPERPAVEIGSKNDGLFGVELLKNPAGFKLLNEKVRKRSFELVEKVLLIFTSNKIYQNFSEKNFFFTKFGYSSLVLQAVARGMNAVKVLNTRSDLYEALKNSMQLESDCLTDVDRRTVLLFLDDFEQSGVHLSQNKKEEFVRLSDEIFMTGAQFAHGAEQPVAVAPFYSKMYRTKRQLHGPNSLTVSRTTRRWSYATYYAHNDEQVSTFLGFLTYHGIFLTLGVPKSMCSLELEVTFAPLLK
ncbi:unnamed protein product [Gongylonema pulchrum]|uniref:VWA domain-containing protein n=1 Tax=Gongylonema pulchrum TaxID=637853 RepID=A0A183DZA1_9BILA|nr:unnamed protein product [Gongylonema pulchrum]